MFLLIRKLKQIIAFVACIFVAAGCSSADNFAISPGTLTSHPCYLPDLTGPSFISPTPYSSDAIIFQNNATVCFVNDLLGQMPGIYAQVYAPFSDCFSSSCTKVFERTGDMNIEQENHVIQFTSRFVVQDLSSQCVPCTADCGGGGFFQFDISSIPDGTYKVMLGYTELGQIQFPLTKDNICMND